MNGIAHGIDRPTSKPSQTGNEFARSAPELSLARLQVRSDTARF